jgi:hypothetical protein
LRLAVLLSKRIIGIAAAVAFATGLATTGPVFADDASASGTQIEFSNGNSPASGMYNLSVAALVAQISLASVG